MLLLQTKKLLWTKVKLKTSMVSIFQTEGLKKRKLTKDKYFIQNCLSLLCIRMTYETNNLELVNFI